LPAARLAEAALARLTNWPDDCATDDAIDRALCPAGLDRALLGQDRRHRGGRTGRPDRGDLRRALNAAEHAELARLYDDGTISQPTRLRPRGLT
jgi:hypothetical protein